VRDSYRTTVVEAASEDELRLYLDMYFKHRKDSPKRFREITRYYLGRIRTLRQKQKPGG
jgi:hypothetical protein